jgi:hypothetical protein
MKPTFAVSLFASLVLAACGGETAPVTKPVDGGAGAGHAEPHGERTALGEVKVGAHTVSVFQLLKVEAGKEGDFDLDFPAGKPLPGTVRGWIGLENAIGSLKVKFGRETDSRMHGHPEAPDPIPAGCLLWIEIEDAGSTSRASIAYKQ